MATSVTVPAAEWQAFKAKMAEYDKIFLSTPAPAGHGAAHEIQAISAGDTAWMLTSSSLVLLMSLPGLALYYGGQSQAKNVLSTVAQTFSLASLITVLWLMMGYSLCFSTGSPVYGDASRFWLVGTNDTANQRSPNRININSAHELAPTIPESVFVIYQVCVEFVTKRLCAYI
jgi:Amt family ammonium transporter